jgi:uncharacterized protein
METQNSYILITGAAGGLGSAFAIEAARRGYHLYLTDLKPEVQDLANYLMSKFPVDVRWHILDQTDLQARTQLFAALKASNYKFWGAFNVAGLDYEGAFLERTREQMLHVIRLNCESTVDMAYNILKLRDESRPFRMINVASLAAFFPMPYKAIYSSTKRMLLNFSQALNEEIRSFGSVTALCPAGLPTTPNTMRAIFVQGFMGKMTTLNTDQVARVTINAALKGRAVVIPGWINQFIQMAGGLAPVSFVVRQVGKRWRKVQTEEVCWPPRSITIEYPIPTPQSSPM